MTVRKGEVPATAATVDRTSIVEQLRKPADNSAQSAPAQLSIIVAPKIGMPGYFDAWLDDGSTWLCTSRSPLLDAARVLIGLGHPPQTILKARHRGAANVSLRARLGLAAVLIVEESAHGPIFRRQRVAPQSAVVAPCVDLNEGQATLGAGRTPK